MTDKHTLTLDYQVKQSQTVKRLTAKCSQYRAGLERARDALLLLARSKYADEALAEINKALDGDDP